MKTLIAYASKGGTAKAYAHLVSGPFKDADVADLRRESPKISEYDNIIVGSGVRIGKLYAEAVRFLHKDFSGKKVAIFISSLEPEEEAKRKYVAPILAINHTLKSVSVGVFGGKMKILWKSIDKTNPGAASKWAIDIALKMK